MVGGSRKLWWLPSTRTGPSRGRWCAPSMRRLKPIVIVAQVTDRARSYHRFFTSSGIDVAFVLRPTAADLGLHAVDHLFRRQAGAVEQDGVGGGHHRRQVAGLVAAGARPDGPPQGGGNDGPAPRLHLALPPPGALARLGHEEELTAGVGEDNRALVAALADDVASGGGGALPAREAAPHRRA